jgi:predicted DsbA family dithiol-disulfide isomerase
MDNQPADAPAPPASAPLVVDFIADFACPWCYLGWRNLAAARDLRPEAGLKIKFRPYMLDPGLPEEGIDRRLYMEKKFPDRSRLSAVHDALVQAGADAGITFNFELMKVAANTGGAHRLARWAESLGLAEKVAEGLYAANFTEGRNIGDPEVLADIAAAAGMDRLLVLELLSRGDDREAVEADFQIAARGGVTGVPFYVFDQKFAAMGAQPPEKLTRVIDHALRERGGPPPAFQAPTNFTN